MLQSTNDAESCKLCNRTFKILVPEIVAPYINRLDFDCDDEADSDAGIIWQILGYMCKQLNLTVSLQQLRTLRRRFVAAKLKKNCLFLVESRVGGGERQICVARGV